MKNVSFVKRSLRNLCGCKESNGGLCRNYNYIMNEPCEVEDRWVMLDHYYREYNGLYLERRLEEVNFELGNDKHSMYSCIAKKQL